MSHNISIKLGPILNAERWNNPTWTRPGRTLYWPGSLKPLPGKPTPIVVDHDMSRQIGTVTELSTMDWTDGPWIIARGVIDHPPDWLRQYQTKASLGYWNVHSNPHINGSTRITRGIVEEISLLKDLTPAEPLAEVVLLKRAPAGTHPPVAPAGAARTDGEVFYGGATLRRYFPATITVR